LGGIGVAYSIVYLLPVDLLVKVNTDVGLAMIMSLLLSAILWNAATWYFGLPASSSHSLIGAILGAAASHHLLAGSGIFNGVNWGKAGEVLLSLLLSPLIGFTLSSMLLLVTKRLFPSPILHGPPARQVRPPFLVRAILCGTCTGVSVAHGSNDGQKGMGLIMLVLIGIVPTQFALSNRYDAAKVRELEAAAADADRILEARGYTTPQTQPAEIDRLPVLQQPRARLAHVRAMLAGKTSLDQLQGAERWDFRTDLLHLQRDLEEVEAPVLRDQPPAEKKRWQELRKTLKGPMEYIPTWVVVGVALALGIGTTVGWKRIVVTVGERIGKAHLTYSQGACAEMVAMSAIGIADFGGLPVSTTQVLTMGVAGTMWANRSGIQTSTLKRIVSAWVVTLPATMLLSTNFYIIARLFV
jgi:phosphate/sulfate permease